MSSRSRSRSRDRSRSRSRSPPRGGDRGGSRDRIERERQLNPDELYSVMCQGFDSQTNRRELEKIFGEFGEVAEINIPLHRETRRPRGLAFIRYFKKSAQEDCLDAHKRRPLRGADGEEFRCEFAYSKPKPGDSRWRRSPPPRRGGGGYGGRRDDYRRDDYRRDDYRRDDRRDDYRRRSPEYRRDDRRDDYRRDDRRDDYRRRSPSPRGYRR